MTMEVLWFIWKRNSKHFIYYEKEHCSSPVLWQIFVCWVWPGSQAGQSKIYSEREENEIKNKRNGAITFLSHVESVIIAVI